MQRRVETIALFMVWECVSQLQQRIEQISARFARGEILVPWPRDGGDIPVDGPEPADWAGDPFPRQMGWLVRQSPEFAGYGQELLRLLEDPEMLALLKAAPQLKPSFRRLLRLLDVTCPPALARSAKQPTRPAAESPASRDSASVVLHLLGVREPPAEEDLGDMSPRERADYYYERVKRVLKPVLSPEQWNDLFVLDP